MASQIPAVIQNENLPIHRGKGVDGVAKADLLKPTKAKNQGRVALRDLSKSSKPVPSGTAKGSILKEKSRVIHGEAAKNASQTSFLTDEEIRKCQEWAKEGVEDMHFTGNEQRKFEKEKMEERVRKEVDKVMSSLHEWIDMAYSLGMPREVAKQDDTLEIIKMELVPEELPTIIRNSTRSGKEDIEDIFLEPEFNDLFPYTDHSFELQLKEDYGIDVICM